MGKSIIQHSLIILAVGIVIGISDCPKVQLDGKEIHYDYTVKLTCKIELNESETHFVYEFGKSINGAWKHCDPPLVSWKRTYEVSMSDLFNACSVIANTYTGYVNGNELIYCHCDNDEAGNSSSSRM